MSITKHNRSVRKTKNSAPLRMKKANSIKRSTSNMRIKKPSKVNKPILVKRRFRSFQIVRDVIKVAHKYRKLHPQGEKIHALLLTSSKGAKKNFQRLFDSLFAAWALAFHLRSYDLSVQAQRSALDGFMALVLRLLRISLGRSSFAAAKYLKALSKECQRLSVMSSYESKPLTRRYFRGCHSSPSADALWRFGSLGRSLPPNLGGEKAALHQHYLDYAGIDSEETKTSKVKMMKDVGPEMLADLREFSRRLAEFHLERSPPTLRNFSKYLLYQPQATQSASLNFSRKKGGNWEGYARLVRAVKSALEDSKSGEDLTKFEQIAVTETAIRINAVLLMSIGNRPIQHNSKDYRLFMYYQACQSDFVELARPVCANDGTRGMRTIPGSFINVVLAEELRRVVNRDDYKLKAKVIVLTDPAVARGLKTRVVTKSALPELIGSKPINSFLLRMLKGVPELKPALSGKTLDMVKFLPFKMNPKRKLLGADLSRASDLIQHRVAQHIMQGIGEGAGWSKADMDFVHKCNGSVQLDYGDKTLDSKRGELMGMPYAFSILCILNVYAARRAEQFFETRKLFPSYPRYTQSNGPNGRMDRSYPDTRIEFKQSRISARSRGFGMGDDFVLYGTDQVREMFITLLLEVGLLLNRSKQFVDQNSTVFTEERYTLVEKNGKVRFRRRGSVKASTIVFAKGRRNDGSHVANLQPDYVRVGAVFRNVDQELGDGRHKRTCFSLLRVFHAAVLKRIQSAGIPLYWPRSLGGAGIAGKPWNAPRVFRTAAAVILTKEDQEIRKDTLKLRWNWQSQMPSRLAKVVTDLSHKALLKYESNRAIIRDTYKSDTRTTEGEDILRGEFLNFLVPEFTIVRQNSKRRRMNLKTLGTKINAIIRKTSNLWKSAKPMTNERIKIKLKAVDEANHYNGEVLNAYARREILTLVQGQLPIAVALNRTRNIHLTQLKESKLVIMKLDLYRKDSREARRKLHKELKELDWAFETLAISNQAYAAKRKRLSDELDSIWEVMQEALQHRKKEEETIETLTKALKNLALEK